MTTATRSQHVTLVQEYRGVRILWCQEAAEFQFIMAGRMLTAKTTQAARAEIDSKLGGRVR